MLLETGALLPAAAAPVAPGAAISLASVARDKVDAVVDDDDDDKVGDVFELELGDRCAAIIMIINSGNLIVCML